MSYHITLESGYICIPADRADEGLGLILADERLADTLIGKAATLSQALEDAGYEIYETSSGDICIGGFSGNHTPQLRWVIEDIVPVLPEDTNFVWETEDAERYRWIIVCGKLKGQRQMTLWSDPVDITEGSLFA